MPFVLDPKARPGGEIERLLLEQTGDALRGFEVLDADKAVHEARKACKRCRAVVALVRSGLERDESEGLRRAYRDAARHVGPLRDAFVLRGTLARLDPDADADEVLGPVVVVADAEARRQACVEGLRQAQELVEAVDWGEVGRHAVLFGLRRSYALVREDGKVAVASGDIEPFHEWRKAVKSWGYHLQLFVELWPEVLRPLYDQADLLQELLGEHHDLGVLRHSLSPELAKRRRKAIVRAARAREDAIYDDAVALSRTLVALSPRTFEDVIRELWQSARRPR